MIKWYGVAARQAFLPAQNQEPPHPRWPMQIKSLRQPAKVASTYVLVAGAWILFSDRLLFLLVSDPSQRVLFSVIKGWGFVGVTGVWLYVILRRWARTVEENERSAGQLRGSEEKFSRLFHSNPAATSLSTKREGRYVDVNARFLSLLERSREEVVGHTSFDVNLWADPRQRAALIARLEETGTLSNFEFEVRTKTGQIRQVLWSGETVVVGGEVCLVGSMQDITEHKLGLQRLRESEERYRQLFELESNAVVLVDCQTHRFVDVNPSAQRLYGYRREEFLQMRAEDVSAEPEETKSVAGTGSHTIPLRWHNKKTGERMAVEISAIVIQHQGRATELAAINDITSRHEAMELLRESTAKLLEAQRIAGLGSYVFDCRTDLWSSSLGLDELFGITDPAYTRDVAGWLKIVHPQDRAAMQRYLFEDVVKGRASFDRVYRIVRVDDQTERWVHGLGKLVLDEDGKVAQMVGVIQDVTERKRDQAQVNLLLSALTSAANAILITDCQGRIEWVNPAFTALTGYAPEEVVGGNPGILNSGQQSASFYADLWATILTGNHWRGELVNRRKDGGLYSEEMTITPVRGEAGEISHLVCVKLDVTERRQLENQLRQAQKMEAIGTLAGGIAHDFNNMLAAIFGYAYLLQHDNNGNVAAGENIEGIQKAAGRAKELVEQILTFSRQREQKREVIRLDSIIKEAVKLLRASMPAQIRIETNLDAAAPPVLADATQIYQVTMNLATNALHAMEGKPGRLAVTLDGYRPDEEFLRAHAKSKHSLYTRLTFADTGPGMDAKTVERIFEPFFTTKPVGKGTGLGLSVVHGIMMSHGGIITVESQVNEGTRFALYFPANQNCSALPRVEPEAVVLGLGQRIILLDDEPEVTISFRHLLEKMNYKVTTSNQPSETLEAFRHHAAEFDLLITDLAMPGLNGLELARQVHGLCPEMPIVLASGMTADLTDENLRAAGISGVLEKPYSISSLNKILQRVFATP